MTTTAVKHQWTGDDEHGFELVGRTQTTLPPAVYRPREMGPPCLNSVKLKSDQPIVVDDGTAQVGTAARKRAAAKNTVPGVSRKIN